MIARRLLLLFLALMLLGGVAGLVNPQVQTGSPSGPRRGGRMRAPPGRPMASLATSRRTCPVPITAPWPRDSATAWSSACARHGPTPRPWTATTPSGRRTRPPAELDLVAEKAGRFPVRLVDAGTVVGRLVVWPGRR